jgi:shikimate dehydrogenase
MAVTLPARLYFGLTGFPLDHSLSPRIHTAALSSCGLPGEYGLFPAPPDPFGLEALRALLDRVRQGELHGLNVTIPHKQAVLPWLDELTPIARATGAVNTIYRQDGLLTGDNTDVGGFLADLERAAPGALLSPGGFTAGGRGTALILGAGGSARAVAYGLAQAGWPLIVASRRTEQAQALAAFLRPSSSSASISARSLQDLPILVAGSRSPIALIVNTTPLGMAPAQDTSPWPPDLPFPPGAFVYDLVYRPAETALLQAARAAGLAAKNGLGLLVEQAALAFERWTGLPAPRPAMHAAVASPEQLERL